MAKASKVSLRRLLIITLRIRALVNDLYDWVLAFLSTSFVDFHTTILPHDGVSRQCRLFRRVAPLVLRHALRQVFRCTIWQGQINVSPITPKACTPSMSLRLDSLATSFNPTFRKGIRRLACSMRLRARHLSHDATTAFAF
jgi:hypothetical protein